MPASPRTYLLSCGGTGGHLSPGIALAEGLAARGDRAVLLISHKQVDARLAAKYPALRFAPIPGSPFGAHPAVLGRFLVTQSRGFAAGLGLVRSLRPAAIVGFGGFTTASVILAGALHGVPVALHEANRVPGKAVRHLARLARRVYLPPGVPAEAVAFWSGVLRKVFETDDWKDYIARTSQSGTFLTGDQFRKFIAMDEDRSRKIFEEQGWLVK
jgi:UDP-N-acetylglucosamine--N-acetylmuramyl-(pentapeptide) pyrophosphoryl-undecaprenol N-acetylglucosamine transferase